MFWNAYKIGFGFSHKEKPNLVLLCYHVASNSAKTFKKSLKMEIDHQMVFAKALWKSVTAHKKSPWKYYYLLASLPKNGQYDWPIFVFLSFQVRKNKICSGVQLFPLLCKTLLDEVVQTTLEVKYGGESPWKPKELIFHPDPISTKDRVINHNHNPYNWFPLQVYKKQFFFIISQKSQSWVVHSGQKCLTNQNEMVHRRLWKIASIWHFCLQLFFLLCNHFPNSENV